MTRVTISALTLFVAWAAQSAHAQDLVAIVDLRFIEATDKVARVLCFGDEDDDCFPWAHHYLWEARVRRVISGTEAEKRFLVLYGTHALKQKDFYRVLASMKRLESASPSEPRYQILEWGQERDLICFTELAAPDAPMRLDRGDDDDDKFGCFDTKTEDR